MTVHLGDSSTKPTDKGQVADLFHDPCSTPPWSPWSGDVRAHNLHRGRYRRGCVQPLLGRGGGTAVRLPSWLWIRVNEELHRIADKDIFRPDVQVIQPGTSVAAFCAHAKDVVGALPIIFPWSNNNLDPMQLIALKSTILSSPIYGGCHRYYFHLCLSGEGNQFWKR